MEFTKIGEKQVDKIGKEKIVNAIKMIDNWQELKQGTPLAFMSGMAINEISKNVIGNHKNFAISNELSPLGLYGIETHYKDTIVKSYWVDDGCGTICIAFEKLPKEVN